MVKAGCDVTVYEAFHQAGGVLKYGIPDFRLPNEVIDAEIRNLCNARRQVRVQHAGRAPVHHRADDRRDGIPRGLHRHRGRLSDDAGHPRRLAERRAFRQRAADALQPDAREGISRISTRRSRSANASRSSAPATRRWTPCACASGSARKRCTASIAAVAPRPGARRRSPSRRGGRGRFPLADQSGRDSGRRQGRRARHALRAHGARRARRFGPPAPVPIAGSEHELESTWSCSRSAPTPIRSWARPRSSSSTSAATSAPTRPRDLGGGRVRRRRHRHRRSHGDRGHGRRPQGGAQHEGLPRPARRRRALRRRRSRQPRHAASASTPGRGISCACASPEATSRATQAPSATTSQCHERNHHPEEPRLEAAAPGAIACRQAEDRDRR